MDLENLSYKGNINEAENVKKELKILEDFKIENPNNNPIEIYVPGKEKRYIYPKKEKGFIEIVSLPENKKTRINFAAGMVSFKALDKTYHIYRTRELFDEHENQNLIN